jgi:hypothetical protein
MKSVSALFVVATLFWFVIFSPWAFAFWNFWVEMTIAAGVLALVSLWISREEFGDLFRFKLRYLFIGFLSAILLYLVFFAGDRLSTLVFPFAEN